MFLRRTIALVPLRGEDQREKALAPLEESAGAAPLEEPKGSAEAKGPEAVPAKAVPAEGMQGGSAGPQNEADWMRGGIPNSNVTSQEAHGTDYNSRNCSHLTVSFPNDLQQSLCYRLNDVTK